jgi:Fe-S cluster assembly protein SufD
MRRHMTRHFGANLAVVERALAAPSLGPPCLAGLRQQCAAYLRARGLPTATDEDWRFTSLESVASTPFVSLAPGLDPDDPDGIDSGELMAWLARQFTDDDSWRLPVINGRPRPELAGPPPAGIELVPLAALADKLPGHLGRYTAQGYVSCLNTVCFEHAVVVRVARGAQVQRPLHAAFVTAGGLAPIATYPRLLIVAEPYSELALIETFQTFGSGPTLTSSVAEIGLGQGAHIDHSRVHDDASYGMAALGVRQDRDSRYASRVVTLGGALLRLEVDVVLAGSGASCLADGAYVATSREHVDHRLRIAHRAPDASSLVNYLGVVDPPATVVFDGTTTVEPAAQRTRARQENHNLMLSNAAEIHSKPRLQIEADDVVCSHGATIGALDPDQRQYLRSRGIGDAQARTMLSAGFVRSVLDSLPHRKLAEQVTGQVLARIGADAPVEVPS